MYFNKSRGKIRKKGGNFVFSLEKETEKTAGRGEKDPCLPAILCVIEPGKNRFPIDIVNSGALLRRIKKADKIVGLQYFFGLSPHRYQHILPPIEKRSR